MIHPQTVVGNTTFSCYAYAFPIIRLAELYLLYAEALNEIKETPDAEVYLYIDKVVNVLHWKEW